MNFNIDYEVKTNHLGITFAECVVTIDKLPKANIPFATFCYVFGENIDHQKINGLHVFLINSDKTYVKNVFTKDEIIKACLEEHNQKQIYAQWLCSKQVIKNVDNNVLYKPLPFAKQNGVDDGFFIVKSLCDDEYESSEYIFSLDAVN